MCSSSQIDGYHWTPPLTTSQYNVDQTLSVYISYVADEDAREEYIKHIFNSLNLGIVKRVDFQPKYSVYSKNSIGKAAFVHMEKWLDNVCVENLQEKIMEDGDKEARIVHDDPRYWVLKRNKRPIPENYAEQLTNLQNSVFETNKQHTERISALEQYNTTLETTLGQMQWWIRLHDSNIRYLCDRVNTDNPVQATVVSQPSTSTPVHYNTDMFDEAWGKRLRKRTHPVNYEENSDADEAGWT